MDPPPPTSGPAAGWFADPAGQSGLRWWDGTAWTEHTAPWPDPAPAPAPTPPPRRRSRALIITLVVVVIGGLAGGLALSQPSSNQSWPNGIGPIAAFVSKDRGLAFLHSVPIHFQAPKAFDKQIASQDQADTPSERADVRRLSAQYRALGLIGGSVNLVGAQTALDSGGVLAYYSDAQKDITVRGTTLTPATKVTIAHEMTHALQDQHFNLTKLDNRADTSDKSFAMTAVEEGDAVLTQNDYAGSLSPAEQRKANAEENAPDTSTPPSGPAPSAGPTGNSDYLDVTSAVPYVLGPDFVLVLYNVGGIPMINGAFTHPPASELDIVNPTAYLLGQRTRDLRPPVLSSGEKRDGAPDTFGAFDTYMTLSGRMDARSALAAADAWDGGSMIQYTEAGKTCTKFDVVGATSAQSNVLSAAFSAWAHALPPQQATVTQRGQTTDVVACDPGSSGTAGTRSREHALDLIDERNTNIASAYLYANLRPRAALCVGDLSINDPTLLNAENTANSSFSAPGASVQKAIDSQTRQLIATCEARGDQLSP